MSNIILPSKRIDKRLATRLDNTDKILFYGLNNLYPQVLEQVRLKSPLVKSATALLEDFINGSGWELNNELIVNEDGETARDLLNLVAMDYSRFNGFALHVDYDIVGRVVAVKHIPFEYCRLGLPDEDGVVRDIAVCNNWEEDPNKLPQRGLKIVKRYPLYNPFSAPESMLRGDFEGQVLYFTGLEKYKYPLATFDAIYNTAESDDAIQEYEKNNIRNGFHGMSIFRYPSKFESDEEKLEVKQMVERWNGVDSPGVTVVAVDEDFSGTLLETIENTSDDTLFDLTLTSITDRVLQHFHIPPALLGISPSGGVFTQLAYQESFVVYNVVTRNRRNSVERVFEKIFSQWTTPVSLGRILENEFAVQGQAQPNPNINAPTT